MCTQVYHIKPHKPKDATEFYTVVWALLSSDELVLVAAGMGRVVHVIRAHDSSQARLLHGHGGSVVRAALCHRPCSSSR